MVRVMVRVWWQNVVRFKDPSQVGERGSLPNVFF